MLFYHETILIIGPNIKTAFATSSAMLIILTAFSGERLFFIVNIRHIACVRAIAPVHTANIAITMPAAKLVHIRETASWFSGKGEPTRSVKSTGAMKLTNTNRFISTNSDIMIVDVIRFFIILQLRRTQLQPELSERRHTIRGCLSARLRSCPLRQDLQLPYQSRHTDRQGEARCGA